VGFLRKLASQTILYGLSTILGRFINFLLILPQIKHLKNVEDYGLVTNAYAGIAFFNILLTYGMETSYFYFIRQGQSEEKVFANTQKSLILSTLSFSFLSVVFISLFLSQTGTGFSSADFYFILMILVLDTLQVIPFAKLRFQEKALKFSVIKLLNILIIVALNYWFLIDAPQWMNGYSQLSKILLANVFGSMASFILLLDQMFNFKTKIDVSFIKTMLKYSSPLLIVGFAGIINETLDRLFLGILLPSKEGNFQSGIYGAFYKITMVMTMFVQSYRFAAEPLFFKEKEASDSRKVYALSLYWFTSVCSLIFLICSLFKSELSHLFISNPDFFKDDKGLMIVPILLLANLFLGIYYNLSIWYKLSNNSKYGAYISVIGAMLTVVLNIVLIPIYGFQACAVITLLVYFTMCSITYVLGQKHYNIPYQLSKLLFLIVASVCLYVLGIKCQNLVKTNIYLVDIGLVIVMIVLIFILQPKRKKLNFAKH